MTPPVPSGRIDPEYLQQLAEVGEGSDLVTFVIDTYLERAPRLLAGLQQAVSAGDHTRAAGFAHDLASTSGQVGALGMTAIARDVEQLAAAGGASPTEQCHCLTRLLPDVLAQLQDIRRSYAPSNR